MPERFRDRTAAIDLKPSTIATLLAGWLHPAPPETVEQHGFSGGALELFLVGGTARLWRAHERHRREKAAAWNWAPRFLGPDGVRRFYGEAVVWEAERGALDTHGLLTLHADERDADEQDEAEDETA